MNKDQFKTLALKSYERGRWIAALKFLWFVIPIILISLGTCGDAGIPIGIGFILASAVVLLKWRGEEYGASVGPGLWAGVAAFSIPLVLHILEICCRGNLEILFCALSGALGGAILGLHFAKSKRSHKSRALLFALVIAALTAALGCASLGVGATLGLFCTLVAVAFSAFMLKKRTSKTV